MDHKNRYGRFTSSGIHRLLGTDRVRKTYLEEKKMEIRLGKSIGTEFWSKATSWGQLMEVLAFNAMSMEWDICSKDTVLHKEYGEYWSGTPDLKANGKVAEVKGYEYKKFCAFTDALLSKDLERIKKDFKAEYWQVVNNSILLDVPTAVLVSYMPYESDLETIKEFLAQLNPEKEHELELHNACNWISFKEANELCLLPDNGYYKSLNTFEFEVPLEDIELITNTVIKDIEELKLAKINM